jgi:hypothetical protein
VIDLYFWPTGNGKKIAIMLEECGADVGKDLASFTQPMPDDEKKRLFNLRDEDFTKPSN